MRIALGLAMLYAAGVLFSAAADLIAGGIGEIFAERVLAPSSPDPDEED